ncbi:MAG TPA: hypothetical protein VKB08_02235 [Bradyrhizobium sp.]|nr:hypothetical protein [Bradyrhizobium sp.]
MATESLLQALITEGWMNREPACTLEKNDDGLQTTIEALTKRQKMPLGPGGES